MSLNANVTRDKQRDRVKTVCTQNTNICVIQINLHEEGGGVQILHIQHKFNKNIYILCTYRFHPYTDRQTKKQTDRQPDNGS